ncbi:hypothetical protein AMECASPLE_007011 [Ameca splendens]|uniref:Uncharacterized protein n=1 Tax=Ameca splendens TaxID=208324 RepID=A0ABV0Z8C9_9TELE
MQVRQGAASVGAAAATLTANHFFIYNVDINILFLPAAHLTFEKVQGTAMWVSDILVHNPSQRVAVMHHIVVRQPPENNKEEGMRVLQRGLPSHWELSLADSTMTWCTRFAASRRP